MRLILLISTSLGLILLNGCAKTNHEENLDQAIGTFSRSIEVDGETREYLIYIPNSYDTIKSVPLLLNFHGFGGSANEFMNDADMRSLAASYSFILVYPQGSSLDGFSHWNACPIGGDNKSDADDFGFVEAIINKVSSQYNIDVERIYSAGYSNGGMMAYGLANYRSDLIAAVASVSGAMLDCIGSTSHPMPVVHLHGTSDDVLPYNGSNDWNSVQSTLDHWINFNNTTTNPTVSTVNSEGTTIEHYLYGQGNRSVSVEHYKYIEGGHVWFSAAFQGRNTSELVWDFVSQFDINGKR
ncbi:dienelactone hydrolase family protein [Flavobacteriaceae bacterium]|nr:dienelactone hydrolase family protein [Flavobacteriaceae bacterium]